MVVNLLTRTVTPMFHSSSWSAVTVESGGFMEQFCQDSHCFNTACYWLPTKKIKQLCLTQVSADLHIKRATISSDDSLFLGSWERPIKGICLADVSQTSAKWRKFLRLHKWDRADGGKHVFPSVPAPFTCLNGKLLLAFSIFRSKCVLYSFSCKFFSLAFPTVCSSERLGGC